MTEQEYRQHPAVSRSELWNIHESPQKFNYYKEHPQEPTPALLFGQVFHKLALEPESFDQEFVVAPEVNRRTNAGKAAWAEFLEDYAEQTGRNAYYVDNNGYAVYYFWGGNFGHILNSSGEMQKGTDYIYAGTYTSKNIYN